MSRVPALKPKEVVSMLHAAGFMFKRSKGSHHIYIKGIHAVTIPMHNKDLKKGTLFSIIKQSGLTVDEFLSLK